MSTLWLYKLLLQRDEEGDLIMMENLAAHKVAGVHEEIEHVGTQLVYCRCTARLQTDRTSVFQTQDTLANCRRAPTAIGKSLKKVTLKELNPATAIGDDRLHMETQGYVVPESFTHGTSEQRVRWFYKGLQSDDINGGNAFEVEEL